MIDNSMILKYQNKKYCYKGFWNTLAYCELEIYKDNNNLTKVVITERNDNPGTSITNFIEHLCTQIYFEFLEDLPIEDIVWIECYKWPDEPVTFDVVNMHWKGSCFKKAGWKRIKKEEIAQL